MRNQTSDVEREKLRQVLAELPEMRERANKATGGKWEYRKDRGNDLGEIVGEYVICKFGDSSPYYNTCGEPPEENDLGFIVKAREDVPKLCDALQAAADEIELLEKVLKIDNLWWVRDVMQENAKMEEQNERLQAGIKELAQALVEIEFLDSYDAEAGVDKPISTLAKAKMIANQALKRSRKHANANANEPGTEASAHR